MKKELQVTQSNITRLQNQVNKLKYLLRQRDSKLMDLQHQHFNLRMKIKEKRHHAYGLEAQKICDELLKELKEY